MFDDFSTLGFYEFYLFVVDFLNICVFRTGISRFELRGGHSELNSDH